MHSGASDDSLLPPTPSDDRTPCEGDARGHRDRGALHPDVPAELTHRRHHPGYVASPRGGGEEERRQKGQHVRGLGRRVAADGRIVRDAGVGTRDGNRDRCHPREHEACTDPDLQPAMQDPSADVDPRRREPDRI